MSLYATRVRLASGLVATMIAAVLIGGTPVWLLAPYVVMGCVSAALYSADKAAAEGGHWRVRESTLHRIDLFFGIVGGLLAQEAFRHKTAKREFAVATFVIGAVHALCLAGLALVGWQRAIDLFTAWAATLR